MYNISKQGQQVYWERMGEEIHLGEHRKDYVTLEGGGVREGEEW